MTALTRRGIELVRGRAQLDADQVKKLAQGLPIEDYVPTPAPAEDSHRQPAERPAIVPAMGKTVAQE